MLHSLIGLALLCQGGDVHPYNPQEEPPIAYFDVVPQQDVAGVFNVGVVAYHLDAVDNVTFTIQREGFEGDFNKDGTVDGQDITVLFENWDQNVGGKALANLLAHWGTSTPISEERLGTFDQVLNPRTGQEEYWIPIDTRLHPDTKITISAAVFADNEWSPITLLDDDIEEIVTTGNYNNRPQYSGVNLFSNNYGQWPVNERYISPNGSDELGDGTIENPYKNIQRALRHDGEGPNLEVGGTVIYLMEGQHEFDAADYCGQHWSTCSFSTEERFVTVTPAPGVNSEDAKLVSSNSSLRLSDIFIRFENVHIESGQSQLLSVGAKAIRWYNDCILSGIEEDWWTGNYYKLSGTQGLQYWTDCTQQYLSEGHSGIIMRNVHLDYIQCDALEMHWIQMALDVLITHHNENYADFPTGCHTDYIQVNGGFDYIHQNIIFRDIYGNHSCQEQGVHACPGMSEKHNVAWVNVQLSNTGGNGIPECNIAAVVFRWCGPGKNNLFKNCIFNDKPNGSTNTVTSFDRFNVDGSENTEGPWSVGHDGGPKFRNVKIEDCWNNWEKTKPLFLTPDASEPWGFPGPEELQFDSDTRDGLNENPFGPDDPWFSPITGILYTQTE